MSTNDVQTSLAIQALAREQGFVASAEESLKPWMNDVGAFLRTKVAPDECMLLAVSGGADSMGMLALLSDGLGMAEDRMVIGHVQHGIRSSESRDLELIVAEAAKRGLRVLRREGDAPSLARDERQSLEVAARQIRYSALEEMAAAANCRWILTAHTLDDSAETVWMRMQSGAPWHEWTGIPRQRGPILRPLLPVTREELREWVSTVGIAYAEDETNADQSLRRNRTRAEMAGRREIWDLTRKQELARLGQMLGQSLELQRALALSLPIRVSEGDLGGSVGLAIDRIFIYFKGLTFIPIEAMWADLSGNRAQRLDSTHRRQIMSVLAGKGPQSLLALPGGIRLIRRGNVAWVVKRENLPVCRPVGEGTWPVPELDGCLTIQRDQSCSGTRLATGFENRPLWLRTWRAGDRIKFRRRPEKLISDLLNEAHLDPATRESTLVLADDTGPIMIVGGPVAERALPEIDEPNSLLVTWMTNGGNPDQNQACS